MKPSFTSMPSADELKAEAFTFWNSLPLEKKERGYDEARGKVNYLRHQCTDYERLRKSLRIEGGTEEELTQLKKDTLTLIGEAYPELKAECSRQREYEEGLKRFNADWRNKYCVPESKLTGVVDLITPLKKLNGVAELIQPEPSVPEKLKEENARLKTENQRFRSINLGSLFDNDGEEIEKLKKENAEYSELFGKIKSLVSLFEEKPVEVPRIEGENLHKKTSEKAQKILHFLRSGPKDCTALREEFQRRYHYPLTKLIRAGKVIQKGKRRGSIYALAEAVS